MCAAQARSQLHETYSFLNSLVTLSSIVSECLDDAVAAVKEDEPDLAHRLIAVQRQMLCKMHDQMRKVREQHGLLMQAVNNLVAEIDEPTLPPPPPPPEALTPRDPRESPAIAPPSRADEASGSSFSGPPDTPQVPGIKLEETLLAKLEPAGSRQSKEGLTEDEVLRLLAPTLELSSPSSPSKSKAEKDAADVESLSPLQKLLVLLEHVSRLLTERFVSKRA